ncbi:MAG: Cof-type HAD-IIB family hydrolase [Limnochordia bacterium]|jgi:Cof subfamily protein (haloacid dehalogenase superfamily)
MYKLVALDMDGTLLDDGKEISPANRRAIDEVRARGVEVTFATGRMFSSAGFYARQLGLRLPTINYNGALVKDILTRQTLVHYPMPVPLATEVLSYLRTQDVYFKVYINDVMYADTGWERTIEFSRRYRVATSLVDDVSRVPAQAGPPSMIVMYGEQGLLEEIHKELKALGGDELYLTRSDQGILEVLDYRASKGKALAWLADYLQIPRESILTVGDNCNDLDLFAAGGFSVAMANGAPEAKERADYVTLDNNEDGVAVALRKFILGENLP